MSSSTRGKNGNAPDVAAIPLSLAWQMGAVTDYHQRSKHHLERYAPGPGGMDWATQPDPFRRFADAPLIELPLLQGELPARWDDLFSSPGLPPQAITLETLSRLLQLSLGLSAWKSWGDNRWALRCNPSSGNLHPTEAYVISPALPGLAGGIYHYRQDAHGLEQRAPAPLAWRGGVFIALTGIHWREAWKYGMRAFRYCQHDCGHALAGISYAAAALGWQARIVDWSDEDIAALTGIDRGEDFHPHEEETPEAIVWVGPSGDAEPPAAGDLLALLKNAAWAGSADPLSPAHHDWPDIPLIAAATRRPAGVPQPPTFSPAPLPPLPAVSKEAVSALVRQRRSAQAFDGVGGISAAAFFRLLDALLPRPGQPPWSLLDGAPEVHPVLFVHRVDGLEPGLYCLPRQHQAVAALRAAMRDDWLWAPVPGCPPHLPLYLLAPIDARQFAATVSCHQDIAADSAFSLGMLARFDDITPDHAWRYRRRFHEAGILGQVLYLEAEAAGVQGTGIGCYFDDAVHNALGMDMDIASAAFQDLYHFTVGTALVDERLGSAPPYARPA